jgi:hypothetical protein
MRFGPARLDGTSMSLTFSQLELIARLYRYTERLGCQRICMVVSVNGTQLVLLSVQEEAPKEEER